MRYRAFILVLFALLGSGCTSVSTIRFVPGIDFDPRASRGLPLQWVYVTDGVGNLKGKKLLVVVEDPGKTIERKVSKISPALEIDNAWQKLAADLERRYVIDLEDTKEFSEVRREAAMTPSMIAQYQPDAILKIAVTEWQEGNKWLRAWLGFGLGHTRVQWEGMLVDPKTNNLLFAFADARINPGGPSVMGFPRKVWSGPNLIFDDLAHPSFGGGKDLAKALRKIIDAQQPQPGPQG